MTANYLGRHMSSQRRHTDAASISDSVRCHFDLCARSVFAQFRFSRCMQASYGNIIISIYSVYPKTKESNYILFECSIFSYFTMFGSESPIQFFSRYGNVFY